MTTHDEMVKALEGLNKIRSEFPKEGFISLESGVVAKETTANLYYASLTIAISCINALLNAGEVLPPLIKDEEWMAGDSQLTGAEAKQYNLARCSLGAERVSDEN